MKSAYEYSRDELNKIRSTEYVLASSLSIKNFTTNLIYLSLNSILRNKRKMEML